MFLEVTSQEISQADAARKYGVDVSVIVRLRALAKDATMAAFASAKPGRPASAEAGRAGAARAENDRLSEALKEMAVELTLAPGKAALGLFGPVPARVSAETKLELLGLIDGAVADGLGARASVPVLDLADVRAHRWRQRLRDTGSLEDRDPGGGAVHGLLGWEEQAILDLIEEWGQIDRSHRKLAHRGSLLGVVFVSPSTVLRVALKHKVALPGEPFRPTAGYACTAADSVGDATGSGSGTRPISLAPTGSPTRSSMSSPATGSATCSRASRPRPRRSCCSPARSRTRASSTPMGCRPSAHDDGTPILSHGQTTAREMTAIDTRKFMALMAITQHHGRPGTPTDQAHIESFFSAPQRRLAAPHRHHRPGRAR